MRDRNISASILGIIGMAAWMLFILGCLQWSSWSPDNSKVLFPFAYPSGKHIGVALYDRTARTVSPILIQDMEQHGDHPIPQAQWAAAGSQIVAAIFENDDLDFLVWSLQPGVPIRQIHAGRFATDSALPFPVGPFPELRGSLYFNDTEAIVRVDLASGTVQRNYMQDPTYGALFALKDQLYYSRQVAKRTSSSDPWTIEFGTVDLTNLTPHPLYEFRFQDFEPELHMVASHPDGQRFAMVAMGEKRDSILLFGQQGFEQVVNARGLPDHFRYGNLQWSKDGSVIYAAIFTTTNNDPQRIQYSVAEISLQEKPTHVTSVCEFRSSHDVDPNFLDISLSPDGKMIATTPAVFGTETISEEDRVLFLINMQSTPRRIIRIPVPISETAQVITVTGE